MPPSACVPQIRTLAAVLLRRLFTNDFSEWWPKLPPEIQEGLKKELMNAIQEELTPPVKRKICDAAAELSRNLIGNNCSSLTLLWGKGSAALRRGNFRGVSLFGGFFLLTLSLLHLYMFALYSLHFS
ncbi:hypothetical protein DPMN_136697 [Dreissena polymorpha]|uniref:Uncharacterized protein n=1 Tax=Dreissena polymorpha TaxID=45954 RepID=A0A9D4G0B3_DREPO|nr:hypothetical protein DPMN_136697 [Dreissena polymorpha]